MDSKQVRNLRGMLLGVGPRSAPSDGGPLLTLTSTLGSRVSAAHLQFLTLLHLPRYQVGTPQPQSTLQHFNFESFQPLTSFFQLKELSLLYGRPRSIHLSNTELLYLASHWPHLETLNIHYVRHALAASSLHVARFGLCGATSTLATAV
ncbi:hypothetical protein CONPUDRAFT_137389 [Coniophora puteana RWD-64-598 SS2]|uniref:Uncharacterized protein n=1 Tax=Coniophora puteana (strain RWD-64-598) TaxID=741705 RepID=A0A5M3MQH8_CONPW|nr:uncharacterized protein CONPUDRAFT_137389 [Coniophora puteana RWD-64-598 SS2]EIW81442.1 hypothetical protein CONPUDRAFT_137389 [Coniophora puteana RWD-64-598 SS2]